MAPKSQWPEDVDVFTIPHSRMKELVQKYLNMISDINFSDVRHFETLLENLCNTFREFHNHEQVENQFIMKKLKDKLKCLSIKNHAVCNCHSDNRLTEMLDLVQDGYKCTQKSAVDRINYGIKLRTALEDFTDQFLPHMEEEEEIFQPMLMKYFSYDELRDIKNDVFNHHYSLGKEPVKKEKVLDDEDCQEKEELEKSEKDVEYTGIDVLPEEIMLKIFSSLNPKELCQCAQVSQRWNELATDGSLWKTILPVQWSMGQWSFMPKMDCDAEEEKVTITQELINDDVSLDVMVDEDADLDESGGDESDDSTDSEDRQIRKEASMLTSLVKYLLPKVGSNVKACYLGYSKGLVNGLLYKILSQCPNLELLDLAQTRISDIAFKGLGRKGCGMKLRHVNFGGCFNITDVTLKRLSTALGYKTGKKKAEEMTEKVCSIEVEDKRMEKNKKERCGNCCRATENSVKDIEKCADKTNNLTMQFNNTNQDIFGVPAEANAKNERAKDSENSEKPGPSNKGHADTNFTSLPLPQESLNKISTNQALETGYGYESESLAKEDINTKDKFTLAWRLERLNHDFFQPLGVDVSSTSLLSHLNLEVKDKYFTRYKNKMEELGVWKSRSVEDLNTHGFPLVSAKHEKIADIIHSYTQTFIMFHESKKPKRTSDPEADHVKPGLCSSSSVNVCDNDSEVTNSDPCSRGLEYLSLSGCYHITDTGLRYLAEDGGLPRLGYLDLSGCLNITAEGLTELVSVCPALDSEDLYYCDNVIDGPYAAEASGCQNLECNSRICCRSGY